MRTKVIQSYIDKLQAKSYLEIGTQYGYNFNKIVCEKKVGVDPGDYDCEYMKMTSDEYFANHAEFFDVIFIDGLHHHEQVIKDVDNALMFLNRKGVILIHDCSPRSKQEQEVPERHLPAWTGDVWRAWLYVRTFPELTTYCLNVDTGIGVIEYCKSLNSLDLTYEDILLMSYEDFDKDRKRLLNLKDYEC